MVIFIYIYIFFQNNESRYLESWKKCIISTECKSTIFQWIIYLINWFYSVKLGNYSPKPDQKSGSGISGKCCQTFLAYEFANNFLMNTF